MTYLRVRQGKGASFNGNRSRLKLGKLFYEFVANENVNHCFIDDDENYKICTQDCLKNRSAGACPRIDYIQHDIQFTVITAPFRTQVIFGF